MAEQNKKANQATHGNGMQAYFIKDRTHPGATDCQKSAEYKMCGYRRRIRQISEYITRPEIKKHGYNKTNQPVLTIFQGKPFNKFKPPGKEQTDSRKKTVNNIILNIRRFFVCGSTPSKAAGCR